MKITEYLHKIMEHSPCKAGKEKLESCLNSQDVLKVACSPDGREFLMTSIREGWGPSGKDLRKAFPEFVGTGREIIRNDGREKVSIWTGTGRAYAHGDIRTVMLLIDFEGVVFISRSALTVLMIAGNSKIKVVGDNQSGRVYINMFGGEISHISGVSLHSVDRQKQ